MEDKYLSIITNFGCHYKCPECVVKNNGLKMSKTDEESSYFPLFTVLGNEAKDCNWVSVSGGGDPLSHWWEHQFWWSAFFSVCISLGCKMELHTSYTNNNKECLMFPFQRFDRIVYHVHNIEEMSRVFRCENEIVRVVFVVSDDMTESDIRYIADYVEASDEIDELSFRQRIDKDYKVNYHLHDFLKAGHKKSWWYIEQNDYNTYYHNGKLYTKYTDIFEDN